MKIMTNKQSNCGFRNEELFCFNCGKGMKMPYPVTANMFSAIATAFEKDHAHCEKTWNEPKAEATDKSEVECAEWWAINGEHGISSKTIFNHLCSSIGVRKLKNDFPTTPSDPDDFKRCYKLLEAVPQWRARLGEVKTLSPVWSNLVDNWNKLTEMYEENVRTEWKQYKRIGMYEFMKTLGC